MAGIVVVALGMGHGAAMAQDPSASADPVGQAGVVSLGATSEVYRDDFSTPGGWGLLDEDDARIDLEDGGLRFRLRASDSSRWSWHTLADRSTVLRVGITAAIEPGAGAAGPMCGTSGEVPSFYLGVINSAGGWVLGRIVGSEISVIARDQVPGLVLDDGGMVRLELECAVTGAGGDRLAMFVDGVNVADVTDATSFGPFGVMGLYASVAQEPFEVVFDDATVLGGDTYDPRVSLGSGPDPSPGPSGAPTGELATLGAVSLDWREPFEDGRWNESDSDQGSIAYVDEQLRIAVLPTDNALWSWLRFDRAFQVFGVETDVILDPGVGLAGPMCGTEGDEPDFYVGSVGPTDELAIRVVVDDQLSDLVRVAVPDDLTLADGGRVRIRLECAIVPFGGDRIAMWLAGRLVADHTTTSSMGPFDKAGVMGEGEDQPWAASFDDLAVRSGEVYAPSDTTAPDTTAPDPTAAPTAEPSFPAGTPAPLGAFIDSVPDDFQGDCRTATPDGLMGQTEAILCAPAGDALAAEYYRYATVADLDAAFDAFVDRAESDAWATDCTTAPSIVDYTIAGSPGGRLACYEDPRGGLTFQWSNLDLLVLAFGTHPDGAYEDAFAWWQNAGPRP